MDITNQALAIIGRHYWSFDSYAPIREAQRKHDLVTLQDNVLTYHMAALFRHESDRNGWDLEQIKLMAVAPLDITMIAIALDDTYMLMKLLVWAYAMCTFTGRMAMYNELEELIRNEAGAIA